MTHKTTQYLSLIFLIACALFVSLPHFPLIDDVPHRDSGVFLYMGQSLLRGDIPYVDAWDHKGIVVYLINAVSAFLTPQSVWGMWFVNVLLLISSVLFSFYGMKRAFGFAAALFSTLLWVFALSIFEFMNFTEFIVMPLQFLALWLFVEAQNSKRNNGYASAIGIVLALAIFVRPNTIAIFLGIGLWWLWDLSNPTNRGRSLQRLFFLALGAIATTAIFIAYFLLTNSFEAMVDAYIHYNALYSTTSISFAFSASIARGLGLLSPNLLSFLGIAGWIAGLVTLVTSKRIRGNVHPVVFVTLIAFPLEIGFASLSGRNYAHYYITWLPIFAYLAAFCVGNVWRYLSEKNYSVGGIRIKLLLASFMFVAISLLPVLHVAGQLRQPVSAQNNQQIVNIAAYLDDVLEVDDTLLVWGAETTINYLTGHPAPTRYTYAYPLFLGGYGSQERFLEFAEAIEQHPPKIIVDAGANADAIPPLDEDARLHWDMTTLSDEQINLLADADIFFDYVDSNYELLTDEFGWPIYVRIG